MTGHRVDIYREDRVEVHGRASSEHRGLQELTGKTCGGAAEVLKLGTEGFEPAKCGGQSSLTDISADCRGLETIRLLIDNSRSFKGYDHCGGFAVT